MIFVILGTQDYSFERLLKKIDAIIEEDIIQGKVIVQAGHTKYKSNNMEIYDFIEPIEFKQNIKKSDLIITHGGVSSIIAGIKEGKKVIAVPRLAEFDEHINNHQLQIIENFSDKNFIIGANSVELLKKSIIKAKYMFEPEKYKSNTETFSKLVEEFIDRS